MENNIFKTQMETSSVFESGPSGLAPSTILAENLRKHGLPMRRFKTGTPARALAHSLDFSKMAEQRGDEEISPFSFMNDELHKAADHPELGRGRGVTR